MKETPLGPLKTGGKKKRKKEKNKKKRKKKVQERTAKSGQLQLPAGSG